MPAESGLGAPVDPTRAPGARTPTPSQVAAAPRPVAPPRAAAPPRRESRPKRRGRRVRRVVRRVELWSVLKISIVFYTVMFGILLGAVALLWGLANTTGLVEDLEGFLRDSGFEDFRFEGDRMFRQVAFVGGVATLATTVMTVVAAALFNLISEVTGGVRFVVIEEIVDRPATHPAAASAATPVTAAPPVAAPPPRAEERLPPSEPTGAARPPRPPRAARGAAAGERVPTRNGTPARRRAPTNGRPDGPASAAAP